MLSQVLREKGFKFSRQETGVGVWSRLVDGEGHRDGMVALVGEGSRWVVSQSNGSAVTGVGADELAVALNG